VCEKGKGHQYILNGGKKMGSPAGLALAEVAVVWAKRKTIKSRLHGEKGTPGFKAGTVHGKCFAARFGHSGLSFSDEQFRRKIFSPASSPVCAARRRCQPGRA